MRILIATDAWHPQVNGVVRTLTSLARSVSSLDGEISFLTPDGFPSLGVPTYPGLRVALPNRREIARRIEQASPEAIHIATAAGRYVPIAEGASSRSPPPTPRAFRNMSRSAP
jgi:hypothetical protein